MRTRVMVVVAFGCISRCSSSKIDLVLLCRSTALNFSPAFVDGRLVGTVFVGCSNNRDIDDASGLEA
jgi:hypothetical protein